MVKKKLGIAIFLSLIINKVTLTTLFLPLIVSFTCWTLRKNIRCSIHVLCHVNHKVSSRNTQITLTPNNFPCFAHVSNAAGEIVTFLWCEGGALGEVKLPALFEGQVSLLGVRHNLSIFQQFNGDIRRMEATHITDQGVRLSILSWKMAVHLNLGRGWK